MIYFNDNEFSWHPGLTMAGLLAQVEDGHTYAVVKMNGRLVSRPHFETTLVPDGARVRPIPMIAGG